MDAGGGGSGGGAALRSARLTSSALHWRCSEAQQRARRGDGAPITALLRLLVVHRLRVRLVVRAPAPTPVLLATEPFGWRWQLLLRVTTAANAATAAAAAAAAAALVATPMGYHPHGLSSRVDGRSCVAARSRERRRRSWMAARWRSWDARRSSCVALESRRRCSDWQDVEELIVCPHHIATPCEGCAQSREPCCLAAVAAAGGHV